MKAKTTEALAKLEPALEKASKLQEHIPNFVLKKGGLMVANLKQLDSQIELAKANGTANFKNLVTPTQAALKDCGALRSSIENFTKEAQMFVDEQATHAAGA